MDQIYANKLKSEGTVTDADLKGWEKEYLDTLNAHFELAKKVTKLSIMDWIDTPWTGFFEATDPKTVTTRLAYAEASSLPSYIYGATCGTMLTRNIYCYDMFDNIDN